MSCNTQDCIRKAKYMIIENRQIHRYCLICITKIKNGSKAESL